METIRRNLVFGAVALTLAVVFAAAAQPAVAAKMPKKKPDLTVKSVEIQSILGVPPYYAIVGPVHSGGISVSARVANRGKAATGGKGIVTVMGNGSLGPVKFGFEIPKIKPGDTEELLFSIEANKLDGITSYTMEVCASARKDAKDGNDCREGPDFAVIPQTWTGSVDGTWSDGQVVQTLVANPVTFTFDPDATAATGLFTYVPGGSLSARITGDVDPDPSCSYSGSGETAIERAHGGLALDEDLLSYSAIGDHPPEVTFPAQASCGPAGNIPYDEEYGDWIMTGFKRRDPLDVTLEGNFTNPLGDSWSWNLRAE